jgi:hypothetical protein
LGFAETGQVWAWNQQLARELVAKVFVKPVITTTTRHNLELAPNERMSDLVRDREALVGLKHGGSGGLSKHLNLQMPAPIEQRSPALSR